jgi:hypothetical protein
MEQPWADIGLDHHSRGPVEAPLLACSAVAACDAATGPYLISDGRPGHQAVLRAADRPLDADRRRHQLRAGPRGVAAAQYPVLAALAAGVAASAGAAVLHRQHP